mgnify:CR=1 FL=1
MKLEYIGSIGSKVHHSFSDVMTLGKLYNRMDSGFSANYKDVLISIVDDNGDSWWMHESLFKTPPIKISKSDVIEKLTEDNRQLSLEVIGLSTSKQMIVNINNELLADNHKIKEQLKFSRERNIIIARGNDKLEAEVSNLNVIIEAWKFNHKKLDYSVKGQKKENAQLKADNETLLNALSESKLVIERLNDELNEADEETAKLMVRISRSITIMSGK